MPGHFSVEVLFISDQCTPTSKAKGSRDLESLYYIMFITVGHILVYRYSYLYSQTITPRRSKQGGNPGLVVMGRDSRSKVVGLNTSTVY